VQKDVLVVPICELPLLPQPRSTPGELVTDVDSTWAPATCAPTGTAASEAALTSVARIGMTSFFMVLSPSGRASHVGTWSEVCALGPSRDMAKVQVVPDARERGG